MKILCYGIPAAVAGRIAERYGFRLAASPDEEGEELLLTVRATKRPDELLALCDMLLTREAEIDAVIVVGADCSAARATVQCCAPQGNYFTLSDEGDEERLEYDLARIVESLRGLLCAHEGLQSTSNL